MHLSAKNLLLISSAFFVIPFVLSMLVLNIAPPNYEMAPSTIEVWLGWLTMIGAWVGLVAFVLAVINWKK